MRIGRVLRASLGVGLGIVGLLVCAAGFSQSAQSQPSDAPKVWVADGGGGLARLDLQSGEIELTGRASVVLTDIASGADGQLYGISFTRLYRVAPDGELVDLGRHTVPCGNALEIPPGARFGYAMGCSGDGLYQIDLSNGASRLLFATGYVSAGDLAWSGGELFLAARGGDGGALVALDPAGGAIRLVGAMGVRDVYGLVAGPNGDLFAGAGRGYYAVNRKTGQAALLGAYSGPVGAAFGWAIDESEQGPIS